MGKERLDILMVNRNLAESRSLAQKLVMAGEVLVNDQVGIQTLASLLTAALRSGLSKNRFMSPGED